MDSTTVVQANVGHGHVFRRPDGAVARCGGPGICRDCAVDAQHYGRITGKPWSKDSTPLPASLMQMEPRPTPKCENCAAPGPKLFRCGSKWLCEACKGMWDRLSTVVLTPTIQPPPKPSTGPPVWDLVQFDMLARDQMGAKKYGTRLQPNNGRDALKDAYEEALDLVVYLRQAIYERDGK